MKLIIDGITVPVTAFEFPGGERHVRLDQSELDFLPDRCERVTVYASLRGSADIVDLVLLTDAVRRLPNVEPITHMKLVIPYVPYARQDRVAVVGEPLSISVFAGIINGLSYDEVVAYDTHSHVTDAVIERLQVVTQAEIFEAGLAEVVKDKGYVLCAPDAGATKKVFDVSAALGGVEIIQGWKHRDPATGALSGFGVTGDVAGKNVLIVDDICDGGGTFIGLANVLRQNGAVGVSLYVTHGIFSKGLSGFVGVLDTIYCFNPWPTPETTPVDDGDFKLAIIEVEKND